MSNYKQIRLLEVEEHLLLKTNCFYSFKNLQIIFKFTKLQEKIYKKYLEFPVSGGRQSCDFYFPAQFNKLINLQVLKNGRCLNLIQNNYQSQKQKIYQFNAIINKLLNFENLKSQELMELQLRMGTCW
ncbi:unnamed protein product [Paramecium primaurelia]|uniref:Uncharacterized protein n=1 Tax=Paramecium primaurelia TaxID=5886 RepID=A0A8S1PMV7_PARPR|nr:unnamed protein product [Paramecium primaurelia]CAD8104661.1 unnamed protein product [Paramecium primaurelia]